MNMKQFFLILIVIFLLNGVLTAEDSILKPNDPDDEVTFDENLVLHLKNTRQKLEGQKSLKIRLDGVKNKFPLTKNNSSIKGIWSYPLGPNGQTLRITKSRIVHNATEYRFVWNSQNLKPSEQKKMICVSYIDSEEPYWYSSCSNFDKSPWPINSNETVFRIKFPNVAEYLFLSSDGFLLHLEPNHPWKIDFKNTFQGGSNSFCFSISAPVNSAKPKPIDHSDQYFSLKFRVLVGSNIKEVYKSALGDFNYISRLRTLPKDISAFVNPILPFSSFVQKANFQKKESDLLQLANDLNMRKLNNFTIFIDENIKWSQSPKDSFVFNSQFRNVQSMSSTIRQKGHRVSLSFETSLKLESDYCKNDFLFTIHKGATCFVDLTRSESVEWFMEKVHQKVTNPNQIESVQFTNKNMEEVIDLFFEIYPQDEIVQKYPNSLITSYAQLISRFGPYRASLDYGFTSQTYPSFIRMKIATYGDNPIGQMIKSSLIWSLGGYQLIQPELVNNGITPSLFLRWIQAVTFMPVMQIPTVPWQIKDNPEMAEHVRGCIEIRKRILEPKLLVLIENWIQNGEPIIRPMWFADPSNAKFYTVNDQFMVGEDILVAPITNTQVPTTREVYFPPGKWIVNKGGEVFSRNHTFSVSKITDFLYFVRM